MCWSIRSLLLDVVVTGAVQRHGDLATAQTKRTRKPWQQHDPLIFEIKAWEPSYSLSVNAKAQAETDYSEYAELHLDT
jgi:hypothetical protein